MAKQLMISGDYVTSSLKCRLYFLEDPNLFPSWDMTAMLGLN
jgi:hypothetical protein